MREFYQWFSSVLKTPLGSLNEKGFPVYSEQIAREASLFFDGDSRFSPTERLGSYHRQVWHRLCKQIEAEYPALARVIGPKLFQIEVAKPFLQEFWPTNRSLADLGLNLPLWLLRRYQRGDRTIVLGIAKVDWAYQRLHFQKQVLLHLDATFFSLRNELLLRKEIDKPLPNSFGKENWCLLERNGWKKIGLVHAWLLQKWIKASGGYLIFPSREGGFTVLGRPI